MSEWAVGVLEDEIEDHVMPREYWFEIVFNYLDDVEELAKRAGRQELVDLSMYAKLNLRFLAARTPVPRVAEKCVSVLEEVLCEAGKLLEALEQQFSIGARECWRIKTVLAEAALQNIKQLLENGGGKHG